MIKSGKKLGMIFAIISGITYGFYGIFSSLLVDSGLAEVTIATLPALALAVVFGIKTLFKPKVLKDIPFKFYLGMIAQGFFLCNAMQYSYTQAYSLGMPVGVVSIVAFSNVLVIMVESYFIFKYKFTLRKIIAVTVVLVGVAFVIGLFNESMAGFTKAGLMWTLLIPLFAGTNTTVNSYFLSKGFDSDAILFIVQTSALIFMMIFIVHPSAFFTDLAICLSGKPVYLAAFLGFCLVPHAICYDTMQRALQRIEPTIYQILMAMDPFTAMILGAIIFRQAIGSMQIIGGILVIGAVAYISIMEGKESIEEAKSS